jgi:hypothetical protein
MATVVQNSTPNSGNVEVQKRNFINSWHLNSVL